MACKNIPTGNARAYDTPRHFSHPSGALGPRIAVPLQPGMQPYWRGQFAYLIGRVDHIYLYVRTDYRRGEEPITTLIEDEQLVDSHILVGTHVCIFIVMHTPICGGFIAR